jgi:platelet-activating factor acetylhydrolase IB subunit alpha
MSLTSKQQEELNKSILGYLHSNHYKDTYDSFAKEIGYGVDIELESDHHTSLVKKWGSIIKLQKRILELENINKELQDDIHYLAKHANAANGSNADHENHNDSNGNGGENGHTHHHHHHKGIDTSLSIPYHKKHTLVGHRDAINSVLFHPHYSLLFTCSDDSTVRIWDYEEMQCQCVKALTGHTDAVNDMDISKNGTMLITGMYCSVV